VKTNNAEAPHSFVASFMAGSSSEAFVVKTTDCEKGIPELLKLY
jgi:hypothetical protein